ncbi:MAG: hypothetical protein M3255_00425 [Pseudomonadota bacterium]|jgi:hypothetical protein|nr:hypothetical protein [Pseudomonadota bacterium]
MEAKSVEPNAVQSWVVRGWQLFVKNPGMWIFLTFIGLVVDVILALFPLRLLGSLALAVITPALFSGLLYGAAELDNGRSLNVEDLFRGLTDPVKRMPLLKLSVVTVVAAIPGLIGLLMFKGGMFLTLIGSLIVAALSVAVVVALIYACPLVMFAGMDPVEAVRNSIDTCRKNLVPMAVFGGMFLFAAVVAAIPLWLGFLVLLPVTVCAVYASYKDLYSQPEPISQVEPVQSA